MIMLLVFLKNLDEFRSGFNGNNMMYYMGQYGPILNQPMTSMLVNDTPHNCNTGEFNIVKHDQIIIVILILI